MVLELPLQVRFTGLALPCLTLHDPERSSTGRRNGFLALKPRYEREGDVDDVVFPCGWINRNGTVYMYYGAADSCIGLATAKLQDLTDYILRCPLDKEELP